MVTKFETIHGHIHDVSWGTINNLDSKVGTFQTRYAAELGTVHSLSTSWGTVNTRLVIDRELDFRASNVNDATLAEWRMITGSGTPGSATGTLAAAGSLYIDINGTGQVWMKTSAVNGSWYNISLNDGAADRA